jgi:hypothetical protein
VAVGSEVELLLQRTKDWRLIEGVKELEAQNSLQRAAVRAMLPSAGAAAGTSAGTAGTGGRGSHAK